jgi:hypothetical protein
VRLTTSPSSRAESHEIWEPKLPGTHWATPGLLRDCLNRTKHSVHYGPRFGSRQKQDNFLLSKTPPDRLLIQLCLLFNEYCISSLEVKRPEPKTNNPSLSIAESKNVCSCNYSYIPPNAFMACSGSILPLTYIKIYKLRYTLECPIDVSL